MKIRCLSTLGLLSLLARRGPKPGRFRHSALALFWTLCTVFPCAAAGLAEDTPAPPVDIQAETIFRGGYIVTVDPKQPEVQALAIAQGKIIAVGDEKTVMQRRGTGTKVIDLQGKTLMPGFVEPHTHMMQTALDIYMVENLSSFKVPMNPGTIPQIQEDLKKALKKVPVGGWLIAFGVDPSRANPFMASLDATTLDAVSTKVPIFVLNQSGHIAYVNHRAIELAGITPNTPNPKGGVYERVGGGETGELTGVLQEGPAYRAFQEKIKIPTDGGVWLEALRQTYKSVAEAGVTTATEMTLGAVTGSISQELDLLEGMGAELETPLRIRAYVFADVITPEQPLKIKPSHGKNDLFKVIGIKFIADGSTQGLTAALKEPYLYPPNTPNRGTLNYTDPATLFNAAKDYLDLGWQLAIHSNGDRTTDQVLWVYSQLNRESASTGYPGPAELRCRIEHLTVTEEDQLEQIKSLGLTPSMTIGHVYFWGYAFGATKEESGHEPILGSPRAQRIDPSASLRKLGIRFSFNSDSPITPVAPLRYISTAVTRLTQGGQGQGTVKLFREGKDDQRISVDDAIRAVTIDAAYQLFLDDKIGSLEVGKLADLVILDQNPRAPDMKPEDIMNIKVLSTYLSGVEKYRALTTSAH